MTHAAPNLAPLEAGTRALVLDFRRIASIDETGAVLLQQLSTRLQQRGVALLLAGVQADNVHGRRLRTYGCFREADRPDWWPDADRAVEAAEQRLLAEAGHAAPAPEVALADSALLHGLTPDEQARVAAHLQPLPFTAGAWLFRRGDPGDRLFVLTAGSVSIVGDAAQAQQGADTGATGHHGPRFVSYSPGALFGETAMLDGGGRSAGAVADSDCTVHALSEQGLAALAAADPPLGLRLMRNIALHLSQRLRGADWAWRADGG
jgi:CRP-like cAMP-binding protein